MKHRCDAKLSVSHTSVEFGWREGDKLPRGPTERGVTIWNFGG